MDTWTNLLAHQNIKINVKTTRIKQYFRGLVHLCRRITREATGLSHLFETHI